MSSHKIVTKVFFSCCLNSFIMEILMARAPDSANFITFSQFLFITIQGLLNMKSRMLAPKIPLKQYFVLITLFFVTSFANNYVYALDVPSTLHMIIRSASSPASMLVSWCAKQKRPKLNSIIGSILITVGVALAMYGGAKVVDVTKGNFLYWCLGVAILLSTLLTGALTGLQQEILYSKYGKHPEEVFFCVHSMLVQVANSAYVRMFSLDYGFDSGLVKDILLLLWTNLVVIFQMLFYTHALPLPLFLGIYPQLYHTAANLSWELWSIVVFNIISQFYCAHSVHKLATNEPTVTVTFILTLRKFISLMISSVVFKNNLTLLHVVGTGFVIVGTYYYFDFFSHRQQRPVSLKDQ